MANSFSAGVGSTEQVIFAHLRTGISMFCYELAVGHLLLPTHWLSEQGLNGPIPSPILTWCEVHPRLLIAAL